MAAEVVGVDCGGAEGWMDELSPKVGAAVVAGGAEVPDIENESDTRL